MFELQITNVSGISFDAKNVQIDSNLALHLIDTDGVIDSNSTVRY